jgi:cytochrome c oxidase assembly factor CtaG
MQYCAFALLVPALLVAGAPWRWLGLANEVPPMIDDDGRIVSPGPLRRLDEYAMARTRHENNTRSLWLLGLFVVLNVFWRVAPVVDFVVRHGWVVVFESLSLVVVGAIFWSELIDSPPLVPRTTRPYRVAMSAIVMWVLWILAYIGAMSRSSFYTAFHHVAGHGISGSADQQFAAGLVWFLSAVVFVPVIYWNLVHWLQADENPTDELNQMIRRQRWIGP